MTRPRALAQVLRRVGRAWVDDSLGDTAAALTYYGMLSVFPCLLLMVATCGLLLSPTSIAALVHAVERVAPQMATELVRQRLSAIRHDASGRLLVMALVSTLVGTAFAVDTLAQALNRCYGVRETRGFWRRSALAVTTMIVAGVIGLLAVAVTFVGPLGIARLDVKWAAIARWGYIPLAALLTTLLWAFVYWALPNRKERFRLFTPGAIVGALLWVAASVALNAYVRWSRSYEITYGALGGVIVLLLWMWLSSSAVLIGAAINKAATSARWKPPTPSTLDTQLPHPA
jgi:membrane protein